MTTFYAVFGGHLPDPSTSGPEDIVDPEFVGMFTDKDEARSAWNGASYATVDDAHRRHFVKAISFGADADGQKAAKLMQAMLPHLRWLKAEDVIDLHPQEIIGLLALPRVATAASELWYPGGPAEARAAVRTYLDTLPEFDPEKGVDQATSAQLAHDDAYIPLCKTFEPVARICGPMLRHPIPA